MKQLILTLATTVVLFACNNKPDPAVAAQERQAVIDSITAVNTVKQRTIDSMNAIKKEQRQTASTTQTSEQGGGGGGESTAATTTPAKKKGLSHTAKGAIVGAGTGAITGAIVNKNDRVKGAAIGTIVGAGAGAGIGAIVDHSKKKKEAAKQQ